MKTNEMKELHTKTVAELASTIAQLRTDMEKMELERRSGTLHNVSLVKNKKKDLAKLLTVLKQKEFTLKEVHSEELAV